MYSKPKAAQEFVPIKEIRDGIIILKDGSFRAIVLANATNLALKSYDEQRATIMQFQNFLNTLDFSTQIVIQSRRLDIRPYLTLLENRMKVQTEPLLKLQTHEYIEFIKNFTESVNIMTKNFFVVVPYAQNILKTSGNPFERFFRGKKEATEEQLDFEEKRSQIEQRVGVIQQGLSSCGIRSEQLGTEEAVEVFYRVFNPGNV